MSRLLAALLLPAALHAQQAAPPVDDSHDAPADAPAAEAAPATLPDLEIHAVVRIDELVFEEVPTVTVALPGTPGRTVVDRADRENLPSPVQPGTVYRDVVVRLVISSTFPMPLLEQILAGAQAAAAAPGAAGEPEATPEPTPPEPP
jgi:hypothetical protein